MKKLALICISLLTFFGGIAYAASPDATLRTVTRLGCYSDVDQPVCFLTISGAAVGPSSCASTSLRWDGSTTAGKNIYATAALAIANNLAVDVDVDDSQCFTHVGGSFPHVRWLAVRR